MAILYSILMPVVQAVYYILEFYKWTLIISILLSWLNPDPYNPIVRFIYSLTEPVLYRIRQIVRLRMGMIDFTPVVLFVLIQIVQNLLQYVIGSMRVL